MREPERNASQPFGVNVQMLRNSLKAFTFFDVIGITLIELLAFVQSGLIAYFFLDILVLLHQGKRINKPSSMNAA